MSERTALEIAARLHELYYGKTGGEAVAMLRKQHAEIDRLTAERDKSIVAAVAAEREAHAAEIERLRAVIRKAEWITDDDDGEPFCGNCGANKSRGHDEECPFNGWEGER